MVKQRSNTIRSVRSGHGSFDEDDNQWLLVDENEREPKTPHRRRSNNHHQNRESWLSMRSSILHGDLVRGENPFEDGNEIPSKSNIAEATINNDVAALREGLNVALGTSSKAGEWLVSKEEKQNLNTSNLSPNHKPISQTDSNNPDLTDNIPLQDLNYDQSTNVRNHSNSYLFGSSKDSSPRKPKLTLSIDPSHLEMGMPTSDQPMPSPTPKKFTDVLTRLSERIGAKSSVNVDTPVSATASTTDLALVDTASAVHENNLRGSTPSHLESSFADDTFLKPISNNSDQTESQGQGLGLALDVPSVYGSKQRSQSYESILQDSTSLNDELISHSSKKVPYQPYVPQAPVLTQSHSSLANTVMPTTSNKDHNLNLNASMYLFGKSLKIFGADSKFRQQCYLLTQKKWVNVVLLILLILQVCLLSYRQWNPEEMHGYVFEGNNFADYLLIVINVCYTIEVLAKIVAFGLYDDAVMFDECGLPRPKSIFFWKFDNSVLYKLLKAIGMLKKIGNKNSNPRPDTQNVPLTQFQQFQGSVDIKEINLHEPSQEGNSFEQNDQFAERLNAKYHLNSHHNKNITHANTFINPIAKSKNIDQLHLKRAFLRSSWQRLDFVSMICFWISLLLSIDRYDAKHNILLFRCLSCLRILRLCNLTNGTSTILGACELALPQIVDVSLFIFCFWILFGIIGVQSFHSSYRRHCVWTNPNDPSETYTNDKMCGSWLNVDGSHMSYLYKDLRSSGVIKGYRCPVYSKCIEGENPSGDTVSFDNIFNSLELVFVIMSANTFTDLMYDTMDSENLVASLFFISTIFILTVWLVNVLIAVVVSSFEVTTLAAKEKRTKKSRFNFFSYDLKNSNVDKLKARNKPLRYYYNFEFISIIAIIIDLLAQCFRTSSMSKSLENTLFWIEFSFTMYFCFEIIVRFLLHYPRFKDFFTSKRNCFDLFLVVITTIIIIPPIKEKMGQVYYWFTVFQIMRFYRVVIAYKFTSNLWFQILQNIDSIFDLALFYFIFLYLISIIIARFYEGVITKDIIDEDDIEFTMNTLPNAFISLYIITSTENWTDILYALQEHSKNLSSRIFGSTLLIIWFIFSNMIILNVFIAVIAKTLEVSEAGKRRAQLHQFIDTMTTKLQTLRTDNGMLSKMKKKLFRYRGQSDDLQTAVINLLLSGTAVNDFLDDDDDSQEETETSRTNAQSDESDIKNVSNKPWKRFIIMKFEGLKAYFVNPFYTMTKATHELNDFNPAEFAKRIISDRNNLISKQNMFLDENPNFNKVFWLMQPNHFLRRFCQKIVKSSFGERIDGVDPNKLFYEIFVSIMFVATICLVVFTSYLTPLIRNKLNEEHGYWNWGSKLEVSFTILFTIEFLLKVVADGLIFTPNAYMRSSWNLIDMIVLLALWIEFIAFLKNDGNLSRIIRGIKALRALRLLTISETAKNNFHNTMISGFGKIVGAGVISLCLLFPFSIWGLNIFNGRLGYCIDGTSDISSCYNEYEGTVFNWDVISPNVYTEPQLEFNSWKKSFATLFEIVSLEGWSDLLYNVMRSTGVGTVPAPFASPFNGFFVVFFNFIAIIFILTLFVSVIISNYSKKTGRAYMTRDQRSWYEVKKILIQVKPSKRKDPNTLNKVKRFCYRMTVERNIFWRLWLDLLLCTHVLALLLEGVDSSAAEIFRIVIFTVTSFSFSINVTMLLYAQGFHTFARNKWNWFYAFVSYGAFITTVLDFSTQATNGFVNANKLFLVGILTLIIPRSQKLSQLLRFASASLPHLLSLLFTWVVVFMVFAIAMNQIFGLTKIGPNSTDNINLRSVTKALILLFRCSFGEGWNYIMDDFALEEPFCTVSDNVSDCGSKQYAYFLFVAWNLISMYIFLNMFVSLILDSFSYISNNSSYTKLIERKEIRQFKRTWQKFDPEGTGYIDPKHLSTFLHSLNGSLSFHFYTGSLEIKELCKLWFKRNNPFNPYDITVNNEAIEETLRSLDIPKIRERRLVYERFIEEAMLTMELNNDPGISFSRILLQLPLYTSFDSGQCLNLIDFLDRRLLLQKVEKRLQIKKVYDTIAAFAVRWLYINGKLDCEHITDTVNENRSSFIEINEEQTNADDSDNSTTDIESIGSDDNDKSMNRGTMYEPKSPIHLVTGMKGRYGNRMSSYRNKYMEDDSSDSDNK